MDGVVLERITRHYDFWREANAIGFNLLSAWLLTNCLIAVR